MSFRNKAIDKVLSWIPDGKLKVAASLRSERKSKGAAAEIKRSSVLFSPKTLNDWKNAIALASDGEEPDFTLLAELYQNLRLDSHYVSVVETRIYRVLRSKFLFRTEAGDEVPEVKELFQRPWFEEWLKYSLLSKFEGVKVLENFYLDDALETDENNANSDATRKSAQRNYSKRTWRCNGGRL